VDYKQIIKNKKFLISLIIIIVILIGVILFSVIKHYNLDNVRFEREYEKLNNKMTSDGREYPFVDVPSDNVIRYSSYEELVKIIDNKDDAVIYLGNNACLYCRTVVQVLLDVSSNTEIDKIYYIDVRNESSKVGKIVEVIGDKIIGNNKNLELPLVLFIVDGRVVSFKIGTFVSHKDPYKKLNDTQLSALTNVYMTGINDVIAGMQN